MGTNRAVILGGGPSLQRGIKQGLWKKLNNELTIGTNIIFDYMVPTVTTFVDIKFWEKYKEKIKQQPLVVCKKHGNNIPQTNNIFLVHTQNDYHGIHGLKRGLYRGVLTGLMSIHLAICLGVKEIYLLGFNFSRKEDKKIDSKNRPLVHFFQEEKDKQDYNKLANTRYYDQHNPKELFKPFEDEKRVKIYNVCPESHIPNFTKISYKEFFEILRDKPQYIAQTLLRTKIKEKLVE